MGWSDRPQQLSLICLRTLVNEAPGLAVYKGKLDNNRSRLFQGHRESTWGCSGSCLCVCVCVSKYIFVGEGSCSMSVGVMLGKSRPSGWNHPCCCLNSSTPDISLFSIFLARGTQALTVNLTQGLSLSLILSLSLSLNLSLRLNVAQGL